MGIIFNFKKPNKELSLKEEVVNYAQALGIKETAILTDIVAEVDFDISAFRQKYQNGSGKLICIENKIVSLHEFGAERQGSYKKSEFPNLEDFFKRLSAAIEDLVFMQIFSQTCKTNNIRIEDDPIRYSELLNDIQKYVASEFEKKRSVYFASKQFKKLKKVLNLQY
jgi:hypothetical protein